VRIGTSGWSYPAGRGTWNGVFYPVAPGRRPSRHGPGAFDELAYYAEHFDTVEVNSTFYRPVGAATAASWVERTPPGFEFAVKLYQKFTHPKMFAESTGQVDATVRDQDVASFLRGIEPLANAGRLGPVLAQFPPSFKASAGTFDYLEWLLKALGDLQMVVELRHRSWSDEVTATLAVLGEHGASLAQIDEPKFRFSIRQDHVPRGGGLYYLRMHGRNAAQWWRPTERDERYNYLYSEEELAPYVERAADARTQARRIYMILNNHFDAKAVANGVMLKRSFGLPITGTFPERFVERYPELREVVTVADEGFTLES
jgi:uncharacterized protein YecE (DUF72 family)